LRVRHTRRQMLMLLIVSSLAGCAPGGGLPSLPPLPPGPYRLGPGDTVRLIVFGQKELTNRFEIDDSGMIDMPLLGPVRASGRTIDGLARHVAALLQERGMLLHPSVAAEIHRYRPFSILGEVNKPGQYRFQPGMTVLTAVSLAGGFTYRAVESRVAVIRLRHGQPREYRAGADALVAPGDVIKVFERHF
jgi:polysaccharide export outer membrane protein